jgi:hypothetical protein
LEPSWCILLQKCIKTTNGAHEVTPAVKRWISDGLSENISTQLIRLIVHCINLQQQTPDGVLLAQLSEYLSTSSKREVCISILEAYTIIDPSLVLDFLTNIMSCFRLPIYYEKVILLLNRIHSRLKESPIRGRGKDWFSAKVKSHLLKMSQDLGGSFDDTVYSVLTAISSAS